jgi:hypothetical protein
MPRVDDYKFWRFFHFWRWEYTRRNEKYREENNILVTGDIPYSNNGAYLHNFGTYCFWTCDGNDAEFFQHKYYFNANEILDDVLNNRIKHVFPDPGTCFKGVIDVPLTKKGMKKFVELYVNHSKLTHTEAYDFRKELGPIDEYREMYGKYSLLLIDTTQPIERIIAEIKWNLSDDDEPRDMMRIDISDNCKLSRYPRNGDLPRAVGVWLWDYVQKHNIPWNHRARAYTAFEDAFKRDTSKIVISGYNDPKQLSELLDLAKECIEKMEVLPGS